MTSYNYREKNCVVCGDPFKPKSGVAKTCSETCRLKKNTANQGRWHRENPERTAAAHRRSQPARDRWLCSNRDRMAASAQAWRARNQEFWAAYMQQWRSQNREATRAYDAARRARQQLSSEDRAISIEYRKAIANDPCWYCGAHTENMHFDHFFPLKLSGTDHWWNLVRACSRCNTSKRAHCGTWFLLRERRLTLQNV